MPGLSNPVPGNGDIPLYPDNQHVPRNPSQSALRPPPPQLQPNALESSRIFVGLSAFRDGERCGKTIFTGLQRAKFPKRVYFGIIDQVAQSDSEKDITCQEAYCALARNISSSSAEDDCPYLSQLTFNVLDSQLSTGPTSARSLQQHLIHDEDEFCLQLDGHSIFTNGWDTNLISDWKATDNEMAVLSTYIHDLHDYILPNGDNNTPEYIPHLCKTTRGTGEHQLVRTMEASMISNSERPQLQALWGAGLSFSKCHAERIVKVDPHTKWMFDGEEFLRASHLWTFGYDMYSPSKYGSVVYHNYSSVPQRFESINVADPAVRELEELKGANRFKMMVKRDFEGPVDALEIKKYGYGPVRTFESFLNFSGVTFEEGKNDTWQCCQLYWVPYKDPTFIEQNVVPQWRMYNETTSPKGLRMRLDSVAAVQVTTSNSMIGGPVLLLVMIIALAAIAAISSPSMNRIVYRIKRRFFQKQRYRNSSL